MYEEVSLYINMSYMTLISLSRCKWVLIKYDNIG